MNNYEPWLHILATLHTDKQDKLIDMDNFQNYISLVLETYGLGELWHFYYQFDSGWFTWVISLKESHISIHTRPEFSFFTIDIFLCNYSQNNDSKTKKIFSLIEDHFQAKIKNKHIIRR
jgi:S-adenosylmethionine decarboxylase